jgi:hypothetical protein
MMKKQFAHNPTTRRGIIVLTEYVTIVNRAPM